MQRLQTLIAAVAAIVILGCATPHRITLKDGTMMESTGEPKLNRRSGFYEFESRTGEQVQLNKDEVRSIKSLKR